MQTSLSLLQLCVFFFLYSFLGWVVEVSCCAVVKRRFFNRGLAALPLLPSYGAAAVLLILVLPTLSGSYLLQYLAALVLVSVVNTLSEHVLLRVGPRLKWSSPRYHAFSGGPKGFLASAAVAGGYYLVYLVCHPLLLALVLLLPRPVELAAVLVLSLLLAADLITVAVALRRGDAWAFRKRQENSGQGRLAQKLSALIWKRLRRAYPGIEVMDQGQRAAYSFAQGLCLDKLIWVFLTCSLLGDLIETLFCGLVDGQWMNRSSVLYGPFSFVWGLGAVVLTVTLQRLADRPDRYIFLAGFFIGGAYEYLCSVFTELVFGTVFWDYSDMPLNIGGRTNVLFCFFWGVLALVWVKLLYPPMSRSIEKLPALAGKLLTWIILLFMLCNAVLTGAAMLRYSARSVQPEPQNVLDAFLDNQYPDSYMQAHWPNMISIEAD